MDTTRARTSPSTASGGAGRTAMIAVVLGAVLVTVLTATMINVLVPAMRAELGASTAAIGWVVTGYALAYGIGVPLYGAVADRYGLARVFAAGLLVFALGGLVSALAPTLLVLVAGRFLQGAGGAAVPALAVIVVTRAMAPERRSTGMGLIAGVVGVGQAVGPLVGGVVGHLTGWRSLFAATAVLMVALLAVGGRALPGAPAERRPFDLLGGVLLGAAAAGVLLVATRASGEGSVGVTLVVAAVALVALAGFVVRIRSAAHPFVPPRLLVERAYAGALVVGFGVQAAMIATFVLVPLLVVEVYGLTPLTAGLVLAPGAVAMAVGAPLGGRLADRIGQRVPLLAGIAVTALAAGFLVVTAGGPIALLAVGATGVSVGSALVLPALNGAVAEALPERELGVGLGLFQGTFFLGVGAGTALFGAWLETRRAAAEPFGWVPSVVPRGPEAMAFAETFALVPPLLAVLAVVVAATGLGRRGRTDAA